MNRTHLSLARRSITIVGACVLFFLLFGFVALHEASAQSQGQREIILEKRAGATPLPTTPTVSPANLVASQAAQESTQSAVATQSGVVTEETIQQSIEKDITQATSTVKSTLAQYLDDHPVGAFNGVNAIRHGIRNAVDRGVPANVLVLLLLFPVVASLIIFFRHVIGLEGFGVYTPAVLAVAFVSTGFTVGMILFSVIVVASWIGKFFLTKLKIMYLPRTAILIWFVSLSMFGLLLASPYLPWKNLATVGIFPVLVLVLLSENFMAVQVSSNVMKALQLTLETIVLAFISAFVMRSVEVQKFVILYPELTMFAVLGMNLAIGKYTGLRFLELFRFKPVLDAEEE